MRNYQGYRWICYYYRHMDVNQEFQHLQQALGARADIQHLQSDPRIELVKIQYGANAPLEITDFRVLVVLQEGAQATERELRELLPTEIELSSVQCGVLKLPVELMKKAEYEKRGNILPGTRDAYTIDQLPTDIIE